MEVWCLEGMEKFTESIVPEAAAKKTALVLDSDGRQT